MKHRIWLWGVLGLLGCDSGDGGGDGDATCTDPVVTITEEVSCTALAGGVTVAGLGELMAYSTDISTVRTGDVLTATCDGSATLVTHELQDAGVVGHVSLRSDAECGFAAAKVHTCTGGAPMKVSHDGEDVVALLVEAETADGWVTVDAEASCNRLTLPCGAAGDRFRVVSLWADADAVGMKQETFWAGCR